jgi:hypothetical protein
MDLVATNSKAADPGKFKDERKWPEWEKAFINYLAIIPGVSGIPLSYVVRDAKDPKADANYGSFNERMIHRAPLTVSIMLRMRDVCIHCCLVFSRVNRQKIGFVPSLVIRTVVGTWSR